MAPAQQHGIVLLICWTGPHLCHSVPFNQRWSTRFSMFRILTICWWFASHSLRAFDNPMCLHLSTCTAPAPPSSDPIIPLSQASEVRQEAGKQKACPHHGVCPVPRSLLCRGHDVPLLEGVVQTLVCPLLDGLQTHLIPCTCKGTSSDQSVKRKQVRSDAGGKGYVMPGILSRVLRKGSR